MSLEQPMNTTDGDIYKIWKVEQPQDNVISNSVCNIQQTFSNQNDDGDDIFEELGSVCTIQQTLSDQNDDDDDDIFEELGKVKPFLKLKKEDANILHNFDSQSVENVSIKEEEVNIKCEDESDWTNNSHLSHETKNESSTCGDESKEAIFKTHRHQTDLQTTRLKILTKKKAINNKNNRKKSENKSKVTYKCYSCSYETGDKWRLSTHLLRHKDITEVEFYQCLHCNFQTKYKRSLKTHHSIHERITNCRKCDFTTISKVSVETNLQGHNEDKKIFQCLKCSYKTFKRPYLINHMGRHRKDELKCPHCTYTTVDRSNFNRHIYLHDKTKRLFTCFECGLEVSTKFALKNHVKRHNRPSETAEERKSRILLEIKKCHYCDFKTKYKSTLSIHELEHGNSNNVKVYACQICEYKTIYKTFMEKHTMRHKLKTRKNVQKRDIMACDQCDFETASVNDLRRHTSLRHENHQNVENYKCGECDYETFHRGNYVRHARSHKSEVKLYQCYECDHKNARKDELRNHIFRRHKKLPLT